MIQTGFIRKFFLVKAFQKKTALIAKHLRLNYENAWDISGNNVHSKPLKMTYLLKHCIIH